MAGSANTLDFSNYQAGITLDLTADQFVDSGHLILVNYDATQQAAVALGTNIPNVIGTSLNDILIGNGQSTLTENGGDNILIGWASSGASGSTLIDNGDGNDILISGQVAFGDTPVLTALDAVMQEWSSSDSLAVKIANITGTGSNPIASDSQLIAGTTVFDNSSAVDYLMGGSGDNWFLDKIGTDQISGNGTETDIG